MCILGASPCNPRTPQSTAQGATPSKSVSAAGAGHSETESEARSLGPPAPSHGTHGTRGTPRTATSREPLESESLARAARRRDSRPPPLRPLTGTDLTGWDRHPEAERQAPSRLGPRAGPVAREPRPVPFGVPARPRPGPCDRRRTTGTALDIVLIE